MALGDENKTIAEIVNEDENFTLAAEVFNNTSVSITLSEEGPYTLFLPTDQAVMNLPQEIMDAFTADPEALREALLYHIAEGKLMASDVVNMTSIPTLQGENLTVTVTEDGIFINNAKIIDADVEASNGVIHVIDAVMFPPAPPELTVLYNDTVLLKEGTFTFVPVNNASASYEISNFTDLGALSATGLDFRISEMGKMVGNDSGNMTENFLILESIEGIQNNNETQEKWFILINDVQAPEDIGMNPVSEGDEVNFLYALEAAGEPVLEEAKYVVKIKVAKEAPPEPVDIIETATAAGNFSTLLVALNATNLTDTLKGEGPFTVFAPTDDAFAALPAGTIEALLNDTEALQNILLYHVAGGKLMAADVVNLTSITTLQGDELPVNVTAEGVFVGDAKIIVADVEASNGVIHFIDTVLIPPKKLPPKWYFFSIPFEAENATVENLLAGVQYNALVYYNSESGVFEDVSVLEPLKGYWINVPGGVEFNASAQFASAAGAASVTSVPPSINLYPGWNAVGSPVKYNLNADSAFITIADSYSKVMGPWIPDEETGSGVYAFVGYNGLTGVLGGNQIGTDIFEVKPYEGYWVYMKEEGTFA